MTVDGESLRRFDVHDSADDQAAMAVQMENEDRVRGGLGPDETDRNRASNIIQAIGYFAIEKAAAKNAASIFDGSELVDQNELAAEEHEREFGLGPEDATAPEPWEM